MAVAVACSGGRDSLALLHCTLAQAKPLGLRVLALHVNHGLQAQASQWQAHVQAAAQRWGAGFASTALSGKPARGESVEAWARRERYAALASMAQQHACSTVLLAHHRQDQAETFLLQALRGAGLAGLSAMPKQALREGIVWVRPWLEASSASIEAYAKRHRLKWVQDPSNEHTRYSRNRLRHALWPELLANFPDAEVALAESARRSAQQSEALALALAPALKGVCTAAGDLKVPAWCMQPPALKHELFARWLAGQIEAKGSMHGAQEPPTLSVKQVGQLAGSLANSKQPLQLPCAGGELRSYRGRASWQLLDTASTSLAGSALGTAPSAVHAAAAVLDLSAPGLYRLPDWQGQLEVLRTSPSGEPGLPVQALKAVRLQARRGAEQFALAPNATARSLKKQFQALGLAAWQRSGPLVYGEQGALLFVPGLGVNGLHMAQGQRSQRWLVWQPD